MRTKYWIVSLAAGSALLTGPAVSFAASAKEAPVKEPIMTEDAVTGEELLDVLDSAVTNPAPMMQDGRGGGGYGSIYPGAYGGVTVDASVTKEVTPDFVSMNAYCDVARGDNREQTRVSLQELYNEIKTAVGADGRVRKSGSFSIYPVTDSTGKEAGTYTGNLSIFIRILNVKAAQRIADLIENKNCSVSWDVRLVDTQEFELDVLDSLAARLNKRKTVFEKLLGKKLALVSSASLSTWADGYSTYDPETNKVDATTTLSVTFDLGGRTTLPTTRKTRLAPKG